MNIGTLYLVATPIGNLGDFSPRARQIMCDVDFIAAEDTRVTKKLLNALDLPSKPMISYFEHNRRERGEEIVKKTAWWRKLCTCNRCWHTSYFRPWRGFSGTVCRK